MVGKPDGLGAMNNADLTFTVFMHHEFKSKEGTMRSHRTKGAFISEWVFTHLIHPEGGFIAKSGSDLITAVKIWKPNKFRSIKEGNFALTESQNF